MIQATPFPDLLAGLRLPGLGLGLHAFGADQVGQGVVKPGGEGGGPAARTGALRLIRPPGVLRDVHRLLGHRDGGGGLADLAGQVQTRCLRHLMLAMKKIAGMRGAEVFRHMAPQRLRFVTGALDHGDRQAVHGRG